MVLSCGPTCTSFIDSPFPERKQGTPLVRRNLSHQPLWDRVDSFGQEEESRGAWGGGKASEAAPWVRDIGSIGLPKLGGLRARGERMSSCAGKIDGCICAIRASAGNPERNMAPSLTPPPSHLSLPWDPRALPLPGVTAPQVRGSIAEGSSPRARVVCVEKRAGEREGEKRGDVRTI